MSESWVVTPQILQALWIFYDHVVRRISGQMARCRNGRWEYLPIGEAFAEAGLEPIGEYISRRHTKVAQYNTTRPIFYITVVE